MNSNIPPTNPEAQPGATTTTVPASNGLGRPPWLEPAVVVAVTVLGLLLSIAFGIYAMNTRIDDLGVRIDDLGVRMDTLGADLNARMDGLSVRIDDLGARMDTLGTNLNARMDALAMRMDGLSVRMDKVYQLLLPKQS